MTARSMDSGLRLVKSSEEGPPIVNPEPCRCCHGHFLAASELIVRVRRTGVETRRLIAVPGGFEEARP